MVCLKHSLNVNKQLNKKLQTNKTLLQWQI